MYLFQKHVMRNALFFCLATLLTATLQAAPQVELVTSEGRIVVELDAEKAPKSVENFLVYTMDGFYNGTVFHRVIKNFMVQGGGFDEKISPKKPTHPSIQNEAKNGLKNARGTLAMARTSDPHSASAQFFINHRTNTFLDYPGQDGWGYAVFGKVIEGMDVVDKIAGAATGTVKGMSDVPLKNIVIQSAKIISEK